MTTVAHETLSQDRALRRAFSLYPRATTPVG